jgi:hypothetical protein
MPWDPWLILQVEAAWPCQHPKAVESSGDSTALIQSSIEDEPDMTGWSKSKKQRWRRKKNEERAKQQEDLQDFCKPRKS